MADEEDGRVPVHHMIREDQPYAGPGGNWAGDISIAAIREEPSLPFAPARSSFDVLVAEAWKLIREMKGS